MYHAILATHQPNGGHTGKPVDVDCHYVALCVSLSKQLTLAHLLKKSIGALLLVITFVFLFVVSSNTLLAEEQIVEFEVKGMSCGSCTFILKRTLRTIDGVELVKVYYDKRLAVVVFENTAVDIQQLLEAIKKLGFFLALGGVRVQ